MAYDSDFYASYAKYLVEPRVRRAHNSAIAFVTTEYAFKRVVDLGCGHGNEFYHHAMPYQYIGVDLNAKRSISPFVIPGDYRDVAFVADIVETHEVPGIVSLFSIECTASCDENYRFYESLFQKTNIGAILTTGFYYAHVRDQETVTEAGGNVSYQTIKPIEDVLNPLFSETRLTFPCPSTLFGEDVIEVWKVLRRKY